MRAAALAMLWVVVGAVTAAADAPAIEHAAVRCIVAGRYPQLDATFTPAPVARARTYFRPQGIPSWYYVEMTPQTAPAYTGVLPKPTKALVGRKIDYYVEAASPTFETARTLEYDPLVVRRPEECKDLLVAAYAPGPPLAVFPSVPGGFAVAGGLPTAALAVVGGGAAAAGAVVAVQGGDPAAQPPATTVPVPAPVPPAAPVTTPPPPSPPTSGLDVSCQAQPREGAAPLRVLFAATAAGGTGSYDFAWTFGDGETSNQVTPGHTYARPGTFEAIVTVTSGTATKRCGRTIVVEAPTAGFTLNVSRQGTGAGTVGGPGIDCGADCTQIYGAGTQVRLQAVPASGSSFAGWSGDCTGRGECLVTMDGPRNVVATFTAMETLQVTRAGTASGTVDGPGIACGSDCTESYPQGAEVLLTATPDTGAVFAGWSGACSGSGQCRVTMNGPVNVTATFNVQMVTLTVTTSGDAAPFVSVAGPGISCGTDCTESYPYGTRVTLTVTPQPGAPPFTFPGWIGVGCSGTGSCQLTMTNPVTMLAIFIRLFNISVSVAGADGRVVSADGNINCPGTCSHLYASSLPAVQLTAIPTPPGCLSAWTGACSPQNPSPTCQLAPTTDHTTTAVFTAVCVSGSGSASTGAAAAALNWSSQLESAEAWGRVFGNGVEAGVAPAGASQLAISTRAGVNRVHAQLQAGAGKGGTWRFELLEKGAIEAGSLRVLEGEAVLVTDEAIAFRVIGRAGERVAFTFRTKD